MDTGSHTIAIHNANPAPGCGSCLHTTGSGPVCRAMVGEACDAPQLTGPADELARLQQALTPVLGALQSSGLVRALHVQDGEVELLLAVRADCGGAALADDAFQALRSVLPDTDIYVQLAR
jgi:hypothetical protein